MNTAGDSQPYCVLVRHNVPAPDHNLSAILPVPVWLFLAPAERLHLDMQALGYRKSGRRKQLSDRACIFKGQALARTLSSCTASRGPKCLPIPREGIVDIVCEIRGPYSAPAKIHPRKAWELPEGLQSWNRVLAAPPLLPEDASPVIRTLLTLLQSSLQWRELPVLQGSPTCAVYPVASASPASPLHSRQLQQPWLLPCYRAQPIPPVHVNQYIYLRSTQLGRYQRSPET